MFVEVPSRRRHGFNWVTPTLVLASVAIFVWLSLLEPAAHNEVLRRWGAIRPLEEDMATLLQRLRWTASLFTALMIHADWSHLVGNLLFLLIFGMPSERALGGLRFLALFVVVGVLANLVGVVALENPRAAVVGCSGAVSGLIGAYLALFPRSKLGFVVPLGVVLEFVRTPASVMICIWALLQIGFTLIGPGLGAVAWAAHIGGFLLGLLWGVLSRPAVARRLRRGMV